MQRDLFPATFAVAFLAGLGTVPVPVSAQSVQGTDAGKALAERDPTLARAHIDALRASVRDGIRSTDHPVGRAVLRALEARVAELGVAPR